MRSSPRILAVLALAASTALAASSDDSSSTKISAPGEDIPGFVPSPDTPVAPEGGTASSAKQEQHASAPSAQDIEESFRAFQAKVTLSTTKRAQTLADVPMTLSWIPESELAGTGQFSLCDAIQYFPGMECRRGAMRMAAVSSRGLGSNFLSNRILLLKDGRPETDPWTGIFYPDETTPLANVKQIEVVRGPGSSLYGSSAFAGVINVITRSPKELIAEGQNFFGEARLAMGQYNTYRVQATGAAKAGPVDALFTYHNYHSDGPPLFTDPTRNVQDHNEWANVQQISGRADVGPIRLDAAYTLSGIGRPGSTAMSTIGNCGRCHYTPNDSEQSEVLNLGARADVKVTDWLSVFADAYAYFKRREVDMESTINKDMTKTLGKRRRLGGEVRAQVDVGVFDLTLGADAKLDTVNSLDLLTELEPLTDTHGTQLGAYADAELRPLRTVVLGAGVRVDSFQYPQKLWQNQANHTSPRASLVFHALPQLTLRANYGHAFRAPTMAELGISSQMFASTLVGNPYLRPETLDTYEAAVDVWPMGDAVRITATGFANYARNFINEVLIGATTSRFQNIGDARIYGLEVEAGAQFSKFNSSFDVAYQLLDARELTAENLWKLNTGEVLDYAPTNRLAIRGRARPTKETFLEIYGLLVGPRQDPGRMPDASGNAGSHLVLPPYFVANARMGWDLMEGVNVSIIATNLFNSQYQEMFGFPAPGTQLFMELEMRK